MSNTSAVPSIDTLEKAMGEYQTNRVVGTTHCENCQSLLVIEAVSDSVLSVACECGGYDDTIRGL
jgi:hypothetical protein